MLSQSTLYASNTPTLIQFRKDILEFCAAQGYDILFGDDEIEQLSWFIGNSYVTPEARKADNKFTHIHYEIQRSITRCYSIELLLRGDDTSYQQFVKSQQKEKLPQERFFALSAELKALNKDLKKVIRATCFLAMSDKMLDVFKAFNLPKDSEACLTRLAQLSFRHKALTPVLRNFSTSQLTLLNKAYWSDTHMRQIYSTEGADNMTLSLAEGVIKGEFTKADLTAWVWRWRGNLFGFDGGPGAKFYDKGTDQLAEMTVNELSKVIANPGYEFLHQFLLVNANLAGLKEIDPSLNKSEEIFLGHLIAYIAYYHQVDIFSAEFAQELVRGFQSFKQAFPEQQLVEDYLKSINNPKAVTPTYMPGAMNNAFLILKNKENMTLQDALRDTVEFMCQFSVTIYKTQLAQRISCQIIAKEENLSPMIKAWRENHHSTQFTVSDKLDFSISLKQEPTLKMNGM